MTSHSLTPIVRRMEYAGIVKDVEIDRLKSELKRRDAELTTLKYRIAAKDDEIARLRIAVRARRRLILPCAPAGTA